MTKLSTEKKVKIVMIDKSTRTLEKEFGVDHSRIAIIKKEGKEVLINYFDEKSSRIGRPKQEENLKDLKIIAQAREIESLEIEMQLKDDYSKLQCKLDKEKNSVKKKIKL